MRNPLIKIVDNYLEKKVFWTFLIIYEVFENPNQGGFFSSLFLKAYLLVS